MDGIWIMLGLIICADAYLTVNGYRFKWTGEHKKIEDQDDE